MLRLSAFLATVSFAVLLAADPAAASYPGLFGSKEKRYETSAAFKKWHGMMARFRSEKRKVNQSCDGGWFSDCHMQDWGKLLAGLRSADRETQIRSIHAEMNSAPYITDPRNWGVRDYWATPGQFFDKDGDCEDYAIAKYLSLRALGFGPDDMRVVVLKDQNLRLMHAVLAVYIDGRTLILDNQIRGVVEDRNIHHYRPIYSINETGWWRHQRR